MPTFFAVTCLFGVFFPTGQRLKVWLPLKINLPEIIIIYFAYWKLLCRAIRWIEAIYGASEAKAWIIILI